MRKTRELTMEELDNLKDVYAYVNGKNQTVNKWYNVYGNPYHGFEYNGDLIVTSTFAISTGAFNKTQLVRRKKDLI